MDKIKWEHLANQQYYSRFRPISRTITFAAPTATLTNFPALVKSNSTFNIVSGYDVHFQDLSGNELSFDLDFYDPPTGNGAWWVLIPSLPSTGPTSIKMLYGDSSITTNGSTPATVWTGYKYVYHFNDVTSITDVVNGFAATQVGRLNFTDISLVFNDFTGRGMKFYQNTGYGDDSAVLRIGSSIETNKGSIEVYAKILHSCSSSRLFTLFDTGWTLYKAGVSTSTVYIAAGNVSQTFSMSSSDPFNVVYGASTGSGNMTWILNGVSQDTTSCSPNYIRWDYLNMGATGASGTPTEVVVDEFRISDTTYRSPEWILYAQNQILDHSNYVTYGSEIK